ncbi:MAG: efflux transporter outer membrane subunit [Proteobacteria bacterium]|nr:efflux transporter outer membrane subunit [Pseudomonadota bacterium]
MPGNAEYKLICALTLCTLLSGCTVGPQYQRPETPKPSRFTETPLVEKTVSSQGPGGNAQTFYLNSQVPAKWWELFHSPSLTKLINEAFINNPTIGAAKAALKVAQENYRAQAGTYLYPQLDLALGAQREQMAGAGFGNENASPSIFNLFNSQVNVSYNVDLFGKNRSDLAGLCAQIDYQRYQLEAAYLTLAANIVTTAITEASLLKQIKVAKDIIALEEKVLDISKKQFFYGGTSRTVVLTQETQLAQSKTVLPPLEKNLAQTRHSLAALIGSVPSQSDIPAINLDEITLPEEVPVSLPSQLVEQRPDIRAAEALVKQANAQIGVATANLLPQITLSGFYGWQANQLDLLYNPNTLIWNFASAVTQPIFHGGALLAQRRQAIAAFEQAKYQYQQTVLLAFQNVADSLRAIEFDAKALNAQTEAVNSAKELYDISTKQYELGAINYLALLIVQRSYNTAVLSQVQAQEKRYTDTAALFQALGGGWWHSPLQGEKPHG